MLQCNRIRSWPGRRPARAGAESTALDLSQAGAAAAPL